MQHPESGEHFEVVAFDWANEMGFDQAETEAALQRDWNTYAVPGLRTFWAEVVREIQRLRQQAESILAMQGAK